MQVPHQRGQKNQQSQPPKKRGGLQLPKMPNGNSFWVNLATSVLLLFLLAGAYTYFATDQTKQPVDIAVSQLAQDVQAGNVATITVDGDDLAITYTDKTEKMSKKEPDAALSQTLFNYGVTREALAKVAIDIKRQSSWQYWLQVLAPFLAPPLFIAFFI